MEDLVDLNGLIAEIEGIAAPSASPEVQAMVTKLLSRTEMLASPEALQAVREEAAGLEQGGVGIRTLSASIAMLKLRPAAQG